MGQEAAIAEGRGVAIYDEHASTRSDLRHHFPRTSARVGVVSKRLASPL
jgi:hypothetical protein